MNDQEAVPFAQARAAAGALFFDDSGRVLLVRPTYKSYMDIPGGYVETGETPYEACVREVQEELGIQPTIGRLLVVDWAPLPHEGDKVLFVFDGGILDGEAIKGITFADNELSAYEFHRVDELDGLLIERLARRLKAAAIAHELGETVYLEHGWTVPAE
ncbi:NUDIX hydrolase [Nonomuraea turkmeniaca]|uniref:NUDIX hydrolase n=1 Tax=Nonomuraea turkmeniaca TaxID=103838 RepID=A0A5S4FZ13_9ACTN|nr:NUDIX hydrolase [Nonomuraea turkmeniaca]TMR16768.1 NUDIX hydrolase [Nonomuraea turkmeniaca]